MKNEVNVVPVYGIGPCRTAARGETVIFSLDIDGENNNRDRVNFALPYRFLGPLITQLLNLGAEADLQREGNPIYADGVDGGIVLDLDKLTIGQTIKRPGWHTLRFHVVGKGGKTNYLIGADRPKLESIVHSVDEYLGQMDSGPQLKKPS